MTTEQKNQLETGKTNIAKAIRTLRSNAKAFANMADAIEHQSLDILDFGDLHDALHAALTQFNDMKKRGQIGTDWARRRIDELEEMEVWAE